MSDKHYNQPRFADLVAKKSKKFDKLQIATTIIGLLFLVFFVVSFFSSHSGNPVSDKVPFDAFDKEQTLNKLIFALFALGYFISWKNRVMAGVLFVLTWLGMWGIAHFIVAPEGRDAAGGVLGLPFLVLGVIYIVAWYNEL
jgi:hypothetical protein